MGAGHAHVFYIHGHSSVHALPPQVKVAATFVYVIAVAITPREAVWALGLYATVAILAIVIAGLPSRFVLVRLAGILPFVLFAFFLPFIGSGATTEVLGVTVSVDGLWAAWSIIAKAVLGATATIVLVATTEVPAILRGMAALRVPTVLVAIAGFMVRYLELIVEELGRMRIAMVSRGHDPRWLWQIGPIANAAGAMFVRSYERGERVNAAMLSRGFTGVMPAYGDQKAPVNTWVGTLALPAVCLMVALVAISMA